MEKERKIEIEFIRTRQDEIYKIRDKLCDFWQLEKVKIHLSWRTAFWLDNEIITIERGLFIEDNINVLLFALIHELTHYIAFKRWQDGWISNKILLRPHNKDFCNILYANIKILNFSLQSYLKNAIEYPIVKKLLKKIEERKNEK
jgi:predicted SprT family Zn-dependent metalloprotease